MVTYKQHIFRYALHIIHGLLLFLKEVELLNLKLLKEQARGNGRKKNKDIKLHRSRQSNREGVAFASRSQV